MKKGIVIALAIAVVFMFVGCEVVSEKQIQGTWYLKTTEVPQTSLGPGYIIDDTDGKEYYVENVILNYTETIETLSFEGSTFSKNTEVNQYKKGLYESESESKEINEKTTKTDWQYGSFRIIDGRLYMVEFLESPGKSFAVSIYGSELILDNEHTGTCLVYRRQL